MALVFDFDGTITQKDTIDELAKAVIRYQHVKIGRDLSSEWDRVVKEYMDDLAAFKRRYPVHERDRCTFGQEMAYLRTTRCAELQSLERVRASGIFKEIHPDTLYQLGVEARDSNRIKIREGFHELFNLATKEQWEVSIISVNWSAAFIRGVLHDYKFSQVIANEACNDGKIDGPAMLSRPLVNASDKLDALNSLVPPSKTYCYFGDSTTDLACILSNKGIVICNPREPSTLLGTLQRLEVKCPHVSARHDVPRAIGLNPWLEDLSIRPRFSWAIDFREVLSSGVLEKVMAT